MQRCLRVVERTISVTLMHLIAADTDQDERLDEKEFMARNWDGHAPGGTLKDQHMGAEEPLPECLVVLRLRIEPFGGRSGSRR